MQRSVCEYLIYDHRIYIFIYIKCKQLFDYYYFQIHVIYLKHDFLYSLVVCLSLDDFLF